MMKKGLYSLVLAGMLCVSINGVAWVRVTKPSANIRINGFDQSTVLYQSALGNVFESTDYNDLYYHIAVNDTQKAWIARSDTEIVTQNVTENSLVSPLVPYKPVIKRPEPQNLYVYKGQENFRYPQRPKNQNVDVDVDGFYEMKLSGRDYNPKVVTDSRWEKIVNDPVYNKIPRDVILGDPNLEFRYHIKIDGQLDDDLSVHMDVEHEPDFPDKYDVRVKKDTSELTFGQYDALFENGEYIQVNKALNGAKVTSYTDNWETIVAMGKQRSDPKKIIVNGSGQKKMKLGNANILLGSLKVWKNNNRLAEGVHFTANYFEGEIEFLETPPQRGEIIEAVYEFTNPIEDFLPVLSRKNFFGAQFKWQAQEHVVEEKKHENVSEVLWDPAMVSMNTVIVTESITPIQAALSALLSEIPEGVSADALVSENKRMISSVSDGSKRSPKIMTRVIQKEVVLPHSFTVKHTPIILGSDILVKNDRALERNIDYFVDHKTGKVSLRNRIKKQDKLSMSYRYYFTEYMEEDLIAKDTTGPYFLSKRFLLDNTAEIFVDGQPVKETRDFLLDYDKGALFFNYKLSYPKIITAKYHAIKTQMVSSNVEEKPFNVGVTYMTEKARSNEEELTLIVSSVNVTVATGNIITLVNNPLVSTEDIKIKIGGVKLTTADYKIKSAYKGEILVSSNKVADGKAEISYKYRKSIRLKHQFRGLDGKNGDYYDERDEGFVITQIPVKYFGVREVIVYNGAEEIHLSQEGIDYSIDYGIDGESIRLKFFNSKVNTEKATQLDFYPDSTTLIEIEYLHAPPQSQDLGNLEQRMLGIVMGRKLSPHWKVNSEFVGADHNFSKPRLDGKVELVGTGVINQEYKLPHANLVEDSEQVFFIQGEFENLPQTKDTDYIINYLRGTIRFRNSTPTNVDKFVIKYQYFDLSGQTQVTDKKPMSWATKLSSEYKTDSFIFDNNFKSIHRDFLSIGSIKEKKGSLVYGSRMNWKVNEHDVIDVEYTRRDEERGQIDLNKPLILHQDDLQSTAKIKAFKYFDTDHNLTYRLDIEDATLQNDGNSLRNTDTLYYSYSSGTTFGPKYLRSGARRSFSRNISDYIDGVFPVVTNTDTYDYNINLVLDDAPVLGKFTFKPAYHNSLSATNRPRTPTLSSYENRQGISLGSTTRPIKSLLGTYTYNFTDLVQQSSGAPSANLKETLNTFYSLDYTPSSWFKSRWSLKHEEEESPLINQKGRLHDARNFDISRFEPYGALVSVGMPHSHRMVKPLQGSYFVLRTNNSNTRLDNFRSVQDNNGQGYSYHNFQPFRGVKVGNVSLSKRDSDHVNLVNSTTVSENRSVSDFQEKKGDLSINPPYPFLKRFGYTINLADKDDSRVSRAISKTSTSTVTTDEHPYFQRNQKLTFTPPAFYIPITKKLRIPLGSMSAYAQETWADDLNETLIQKFSSQNILSTTNLSVKSSLSKIYVFGGSVSPFNLFSLSGSLTSENASRRTNVSFTKGLFYKERRDWTFNAQYSPFRFLDLNAAYNHLRTSQFESSAEKEFSASKLKNFYSAQDFSNLKSYLNKLEENKSLGATFTPFRIISLHGSGKLTDIQDTKQTSVTSTTQKFINIRSGTLGVTLRLIKGLSSSYMYTLNKNRLTLKEALTESTDYSGATTIGYTPLQRKNFSVKINYTRTDRWGRGLNILEQSQSQQATGVVVETKITEQNNTEEQGSLSVNVSIPIKNTPYVNSFEILGEGYLKKVSDNLEPLNSYDITGMVIKGTLLF